MKLSVEDSLIILELKSNFTKSDLILSYNAKCRLFHPDRNPDKAAEYSIIVEAKDTLMKMLPKVPVNNTNLSRNTDGMLPDDFTTKKLDQSSFEKRRKDILYNDSLPDLQSFKNKNLVDLKKCRETIEVPIFLDNYDQEHFNKVFEYNKKKHGVYDSLTTRHTDSGFTSSTFSSNSMPIAFADQKFVEDTETFESVYRKEFPVFENKVADPSTGKYDHLTPKQAYDLKKKERESRLEYNNDTVSTLESRNLEAIQRINQANRQKRKERERFYTLG
jgi:hypothetical protein